MKSLLLSAGLLLTTLCMGQVKHGMGGAFTLGMQNIPVSDFAQFAPEMTPLPNNAITFGGYGYIQFNRFTFGLKGMGYTGIESRDADYVYSLGGGSFLGEFGYKVLNRDKTSIYPTVGVGFYGVEFEAAQLGTVNIQNVDLPYNNTSSFNITSVLFDFGVRIEQMIVFRSSEHSGKGGMMMGVELGYQYSPASNNWSQSCGCNAYGTNEFSFQGFYARLLIGGFGGN